MTSPTASPPATATVEALMTHRPVCVRADTPFHSIAAILTGGRISAVPVVDDGGVPVGVVSETDLIRARQHGGHNLDGATAGDLMSRPVVTVARDVPVRTAARRLAEAGIHRLFVVEDGRLVGVLSGRDLLRTYLRDDDEIREQVEREVLGLLPGHHATIRASVRGGVVLLVGRVEWRSALAGIDELVRAVPGVVDVCNRIGYQWDDGAAPARGRAAGSAR